MLPYLVRILRTYAPMTMLPIAVVIGAIGYTAESLYRGKSKNPPYLESVQQQREERFMEELKDTKADSFSKLKDRKFIPKTIFDINISPNLLEDDEKIKHFSAK